MFYSRHIKRITYIYYQFLETFKEKYKYEYKINMTDKIHISIFFKYRDDANEKMFDDHFRNAFELFIGKNLSNVYTFYRKKDISTTYSINYSI